ncbi:MAG: HD domain-containing protein [Chloroflexota bacterium]|nr:HD domain-containing protein [Chloroflexota bacterium]MDP6757401.1 HD domain-containing protein [Chloroflexota bacterium]
MNALLSERELQLFRRMAPPDQAHSLAVFRRLTEVAPDNADLHRAGLLHDVGKGLPSLTQRVAYVLINATRLTPLADPGRIVRRNFRGGLAAMARQAEVGARFLEVAGSRSRVVEIVRKQGDPEDPDAALLARIDGQC